MLAASFIAARSLSLDALSDLSPTDQSITGAAANISNATAQRTPYFRGLARWTIDSTNVRNTPKANRPIDALEPPSTTQTNPERTAAHGSSHRRLTSMSTSAGKTAKSAAMPMVLECPNEPPGRG